MKKIVSVVIFCITILNQQNINAQLIDVGPDISVCSGPVTLTATIDSASIGGGSPPTVLTFSDDQFSGAIPIGFSFTFYGNTYTQCVISSNNYISFNMAYAGAGFSPWQIVNPCPSPNPSGSAPASPLNAIMGPFQDILPPSGGTVSYQTVGTAPNRMFVVEYCNVPMFSCTGLFFSSQIVIKEGSNEIETHIINKPLCTTWNSGQAIHGLQNIDGSIAHIVPGRNAPTQWTTANEGYLFTPTSPTTYSIAPIPFQPVLLGSLTPPIVEWFIAGNPTPIDTGLTTVVNPSSTTTYVARITGTACSGLSASDTMVLNIGIANPVIVGTNSYCGNDSVLLSTTQSYLTYLWSTGDTTSTIYATGGSYSVYVTGLGGCDSTSALFTVTANANPVANLNIPPFCLGDVINIDASGSTPLGSIAAFHYDFDNNGTYETTTTNPIYDASAIFTAAGNYPIKLVTEGNGGCVDTLAGVVQIYNLPIVGLSVVDPTVCLYSDGAFQATAFIFNAPGQSSTVTNYAWDFNNDGLIDTSGSGLTNVSNFFPGLGTYPVVVTVTSNVGCERMDTVNVTIVDVPHGNIVAPNVCGNQAASFNFNSTGLPVTTYNWNFGDLSTTTDISSNSAPTYLYPASGNYNVVVVVGTSDGCLDTAFSVINISPLPSGTISGPAICQGQNATFTFTQTSTDSISTYLWNFPGGSPSTSNLISPTVTFPFGGTSNVTLIITNQDGCADTITLAFDVNNPPSPNFGIYPICISRFTFDPYTTQGSVLLDWNLGDGTTINDQDTTIFNHVYSEPGDYNATLTITDQFGCTSTLTQVVHVDDSLFIVMPNVLVQSSNVGNNQVDMDQVYPSFNLCIDYTYTIFDRWGVQVFQTKNNAYDPDLYCDRCFKGKASNGATLTPGVYYYVIEGNFNILKSGAITIFE